MLSPRSLSLQLFPSLIDVLVSRSMEMKMRKLYSFFWKVIKFLSDFQTKLNPLKSVVCGGNVLISEINADSIIFHFVELRNLESKEKKNVLWDKKEEKRV